MITLKSQEELKLILDGNDVVIDFYADWCPPCRQLMPIIEKVSESDRFANSVKFVKINISEFPELAKQYEVASIPTLVFFSKKKEQMEKHVGFFPEENLVDLLEKFFF